MRWSYRLGRIAGIDVFVHVTFLLLLAFIFLVSLRQGGLEPALYALGFIIALFGIVILHELGHALTARRFGIQTRDITLLPIGGVARLERMPEDPRQELIVALAGPAVNLVLAGIFFVILLLEGQLIDLDRLSSFGGGVWTFVHQMLWVNLLLAGFNLLPAFPMDGGRVLRALLAFRMDYVEATQTAATVGQAMAFLFGFVGLFVNPFLVFIALFVWIGAAQEASMVQMREALRGIPIQHAMITEYHTMSPEDRLGLAVDHVLRGFQSDFPVVADGQVIGVLTRADLMRGLAEQGADAAIGGLMQRDFRVAHPGDMLTDAMVRLQEEGCCKTMPVVRDGQLIGLLTTDNLADVLMIQDSLRMLRHTRSSNSGGDK